MKLTDDPAFRAGEALSELEAQRDALRAEVERLETCEAEAHMPIIRARNAALDEVERLRAILAGHSGRGHWMMTSGIRRCPECHHPVQGPWHREGCSIADALQGEETDDA